MRFLESVLRFGRLKCHFLVLENGHFCQFYASFRERVLKFEERMHKLEERLFPTLPYHRQR